MSFFKCRHSNLHDKPFKSCPMQFRRKKNASLSLLITARAAIFRRKITYNKWSGTHLERRHVGDGPMGLDRLKLIQTPVEFLHRLHRHFHVSFIWNRRLVRDFRQDRRPIFVRQSVHRDCENCTNYRLSRYDCVLVCNECKKRNFSSFGRHYQSDWWRVGCALSCWDIRPAVEGKCNVTNLDDNLKVHFLVPHQHVETHTTV